MTKIFLSIVLAIVLLFIPISVKAQDFNAQKAFSDYQYQLSVYQQADSDYQEAKKFYLRNPTLQLKEDARRATVRMLRERDQLMAVYLTAIRMEIVESTGFDDTQKGPVFGRIDTEVAWYKTHMSAYSDGDPVETLFVKSDESKNRYKATTIFIIDESLFDIGLSKEIGLRMSHELIYTDLRSYIDDQVSKGILRIDPFNRWLNDTDAVLTQLKGRETAANTKIQTLYSQYYNLNQTYSAAIQMLSDSIGPLWQLNNYLTEMLITIQNQTQ